jgi:hypothetical protein
MISQLIMVFLVFVYTMYTINHWGEEKKASPWGWGDILDIVAFMSLLFSLGFFE